MLPTPSPPQAQSGGGMAATQGAVPPPANPPDAEAAGPAQPPRQGGPTVAPGTTRMQVLAYGSERMLCRPCVDCGRRTGSFYDFCLAFHRMPTAVWARGQHTPFCHHCDAIHGQCHFCRKDAAAREAFWAVQQEYHSGSNEEDGGPGTTVRPTFGPEPPPGLIEGLHEQERKAAAARQDGPAEGYPTEDRSETTGARRA